jgi:hypothetical protein
MTWAELEMVRADCTQRIAKQQYQLAVLDHLDAALKLQRPDDDADDRNAT